MAVVFDADSGRLRLDQPAFDCLVAWAQGAADPGPQLSSLRAAGVIADDAAHPTVAPGLKAVTEQVSQLQIDMVDDAGIQKSGDGWVGREHAALLLDLTPDTRELTTVHPTLLPAAVARVVRLGPHPQPGGEPLHMTRTAFAGLFSDSPSARRAAAGDLGAHLSDPPMPDVVENLVEGPWRCWTATMTWTDRDGRPDGDVLQVLDTEAGLCLCDVDLRAAALWPVSATGVWKRLTRLLPEGVADSRASS